MKTERRRPIMPQLNEIRNIILSMKAQSKAQTKNEVPQIEGSAALAIEPKPVKIAATIKDNLNIISHILLCLFSITPIFFKDL